METSFNEQWLRRWQDGEEPFRSTPESSSSYSGEGLRTELVIMMEQQDALIAWVEELEVPRLTLPNPTGLTFGPEEIPARG